MQLNAIEVVIVDDQESDRVVTRLGLETYQGLEVIGEAQNGRQALELVRELQPDVVVVDVDMPFMDGPETVERLNSDFPDLPLIGFSVHDDSETVERMLESGASFYLTKMEGISQLARLIDQKVKPRESR